MSGDGERGEQGKRHEIEADAAVHGANENPYLEQNDQQRERIHPKLARVLDRHQVDGEKERGKRRDLVDGI